MSLLEALNDRQREAVLCTEGPLLVLAGAGSGKTRVLTFRIAHLVHDLGVEPRAILAFTFTNKAAGEMRERVSGLLGGSPRDLWVGTFHATGVRILRLKGQKIGVDPGFSIYDTDDQESLVRRILKDLQLAEKDLTPKAARSAISAAKNALISPAEFEEAATTFRDEKLAKIYREYATRLRAANALDFDDLIGEPIRLFEEHPDVRDLFAERFRYVLVDEYQDTNAAQVRLIGHLASAHRNLCVVGDDDQSIYGWRGADIGNILSFERMYPDAKVIRLEQNYRSTSTILDAANAVVRNNRARKEKTLWTDRAGGDRLRLTLVGDAEEEALRVVRTVAGEVNREGVPLREVAILYRTNAQSRALETAFRNAAMPYELVGGTAFYQRREVKDLIAYLRLLVNDQDDVAFLRVVNVPKRGIGDASIERLQLRAYQEGTSLYRSLASVDEALEIPAGARKKLGEFRAMIEELRARAEERVDVVLKEVVERTGYLDFLDHDDPDTAGDRGENVEELVAGARIFAERSETTDVGSFLNEVSLLTDVDRMDDAAEKVRLMTIHNAKGLEFQVVCLSGLEEGSASPCLVHGQSGFPGRGAPPVLRGADPGQGSRAPLLGDEPPALGRGQRRPPLALRAGDSREPRGDRRDPARMGRGGALAAVHPRQRAGGCRGGPAANAGHDHPPHLRARRRDRAGGEGPRRAVGGRLRRQHQEEDRRPLRAVGG